MLNYATKSVAMLWQLAGTIFRKLACEEINTPQIPSFSNLCVVNSVTIASIDQTDFSGSWPQPIFRNDKTVDVENNVRNERSAASRSIV